MKHCRPQAMTIASKPLRKIRLAGIVALGIFLLSVGESSFAQSKYIHKFRPMADSLSDVYGIPVSVMLGIAIMESASGTSRNCKLLNNHFGVVGKNNLLKTKGVKSRYKQYPNALASYVDFCKIISRKKFYNGLKDNSDYKLWAESIAKTGYSEIPEIWRQRLLATIRKNKLAELDK
jgi:flagellum-specific peptidoglycan hydrolase FlgJ